MRSSYLKAKRLRDDSARGALRPNPSKAENSMKPEQIESRFSAGECILALGSKVRQLYVICSGHVRLEGASSSEGRLGPGELFGELTAITGIPSPYRAEAEEDVVLIVVDLALLNQLCHENSDFTFRLIRHLADELGQAAHTSASGRAARATPLAGALEALGAVLLKRSDEGGASAIVEGNLRELAKDAGLPMRTAYYALHDILDKRWLRLVDDQLSVLQQKELEDLAESH